MKRREDGRFRKKVRIGDKQDGSPIYKYIYGTTIKEVESQVLDIKLALQKGLDIASGNDTFKQWAERWLKQKKGKVGHSQHSALYTYIKHLNPISQKPISEIKSFEIQEIISSKNLAHKTLTDIRNAASAVFNFAIINRVLDYNPALAVEIPKNAKKTKRIPIADEEKMLINQTKHQMQISAMIMLYTGLRRGELIALTWNDVDLSKKIISVNKSIEYISGKPVVKAPKTKSGKRHVTIPNTLVDFLQVQPKKAIYVCPSVNGKMMPQSSWARAWKRYLYALNEKAIQIKTQKVKAYDSIPSIGKGNNKKTVLFHSFTPHQLRHTYATILFDAGVDVLTAQHLLGHSDVKTTLGIYTHLSEKKKIHSIDKLNDFLSLHGEVK